MASAYGDEIVIQVSNNVLHQISSRVFGILAREILNYNVVYEDIQFTQDAMQLNEKEKLYETLEQIRMYVRKCRFVCSSFRSQTQFAFILLFLFARVLISLFIGQTLFSVHVVQY